MIKTNSVDTSLFKQSPEKRGNILLVENNPILTRTLEQQLIGLNYFVVGIALNGTAAIEKAEQLRPHLVLMDIQIRGDIDGIAAAEQIGARLRIPVIYLASQTDECTILRAKGSNPAAYVFKPFELRELEITIEMALFRHQKDLEREALIHELQQTIAEGRRLSGLLPICISCKKIRDDRGCWNRVEDYISNNSKARFTHDYCPDCARNFREGLKPE